jgi:CcmD family protein
MNKIISTFLLSIIALTANAQNLPSTSLDLMKSNGKIYVVVAVVLVILFGLFFYVFTLDKKITKLEKNNNN